MADLPPVRLPKGGRVYAMQSAPQIDPSLTAEVASVFRQFPLLAKYAPDYAVVRGRPMLPGDDRQLETYAPDESWSPMPGKAVTELYNSAVPPDQQATLIAGDFLHHLADVDPKWAAMKAAVVPASMQKDPQTYRSRGDEFLMGYLTPDAADDWRKSGAYSPDQIKKLDRMAVYLQTGSMLPPTGRQP
jgi:hypothetical protein